MSLEELHTALQHHESPFNDMPKTRPDTFAHLADYQIRQEQIELLCREARDHWSDIVLIESGVHSGYPYIAIRIDPYSENNARRHDSYISRIRGSCPAFRKVAFHCLPEDPPYTVNTATQIYNRSIAELHAKH